jgi:hypothetical protein
MWRFSHNRFKLIKINEGLPMKLNTASQNSQVSNLAADHAASDLVIRSGSIPANANTAFGTALVSHSLAGFGAVSAGSVSASAIANETITGAGTQTATHATLSNGTEELLLTLGLSGSGAEVIVSSTTYINGGISQIVSLTLSQPAG